MRAGQLPALVFLIPILALGGALIAEHGLGFPPCELCLIQRVPYVLVLGLGGYALAPWNRGKGRRLALLGAGLVFLIGAAVAIFHSGVELHWWTWDSACTGQLGEPQSIEELRERLLAAPVVRCDEVPFRILGLSMANWNALMSPVFALTAFIGAKKLAP